MDTQFYFDVAIRQGGELAGPVVLATAVQTLHTSGQAGHYALALPDLTIGSKQQLPQLGNTLRVFSDSNDRLTQLQDVLENHGIYEDIKIRRIMPTPTTEKYGIYRVIKPDSKSKQARRQRRIAAGKTTRAFFTKAEIEQSRLAQITLHEKYPFLRIWSYSTRKWLTLYLMQQTLSPELPSGTPNNYGFSTGKEYLCPIPIF